MKLIALKYALPACVFLFLFASCNRGLKELKKPDHDFLVGFYNVENLFDTINDPEINDEEFLPTSKVEWNSAKYVKKLDNIARVIASMDSLDYPHFVGLAEIENRGVLEDLVEQARVKNLGYQIIHFPDNDPRGIEVAALYRPAYFKPIATKTLRPVINNKDNRFILYVKGVIAWGDTLHLFVNHWTSRYGGLETTQSARNGAASFLRHTTDSIFSENAQANIVIVGDFNDNPNDDSMIKYLKTNALTDSYSSANLYNLSLDPFLKGDGTLFYKSWDFFDQVIVSSALIDNAGLSAGPVRIVRHKWMLYQPAQGPARPNRTMSNGKYFGGFSDHLPVIVGLYKARN